MRFFFHKRIPDFRRVLLVESGSRYLLEHLIPGIYATHPELERMDLLTCYPGLPEGFDAERGEVFRVHEYQGRAGAERLLRGIRSHGYDITGIVCSGEPIMTKWKWAAAAATTGKLFLLNENGDYFWFDHSNWRTIWEFLSFRLGLTGANVITTLARLLVFPFTLAFLLSYAIYAHSRRFFNQKLNRRPI